MMSVRENVATLEDNMGGIDPRLAAIPIATRAKQLGLNAVQTFGLRVVSTLTFLYPNSVKSNDEFKSKLQTIAIGTGVVGTFAAIFLLKKLSKRKKK